MNNSTSIIIQRHSFHIEKKSPAIVQIPHAVTSFRLYFDAPRRDIVLSNNHGSTQTTSVKYVIWDTSILACLSKPLWWFKDWFCSEDPGSVKEYGLVTNVMEGKCPSAISSQSATEKEVSEWERPTPNAYRSHASL